MLMSFLRLEKDYLWSDLQRKVLPEKLLAAGLAG